MLIGQNGAKKITSIDEETLMDTEVYSLKLNGDNSFIANGVVVQGFDSVAVNYAKEKKQQ